MAVQTSSTHSSQQTLPLRNCGHHTCAYLASKNAAHCAAIAFLMEYNCNGTYVWYHGCGRELGGAYQGQYNLCAGKGEQCDQVHGQHCWIANAKREGREEFKLDLSGDNFDKLFRGSTGKIRVMLHNRTPVFIAVIQRGFKRDSIKTAMRSALANPNLHHSQKEMDDFEWFRHSDGIPLGRKPGDPAHGPLQESAFAAGVRQRIDTKKF